METVIKITANEREFMYTPVWNIEFNVFELKGSDGYVWGTTGKTLKKLIKHVIKDIEQGSCEKVEIILEKEEI